MERHFGWDKPPPPASGGETVEYLLDRALRAQGIVSIESACYMDAKRKKKMLALIGRRVRRGELVAVEIPGAGKQSHWARPEAIEEAGRAAGGGPACGQVHILSPFDPLIFQRKRLELFFGYRHLFEAYLPKEKRKLGYFALPVLVDDEIVAALDLKTGRLGGKLLMQRWTWTRDGKRRRGDLKTRIEEALHRFEAFQLAR
jgi:uncharacterized protein YcaQ